jgi:HAMP domain-containing protein
MTTLDGELKVHKEEISGKEKTVKIREKELA